MVPRCVAGQREGMSDRTLLESTRKLAPLLQSLRESTERGRCLPPPLVEALVDAQLFRLAVPRADGGLETPAVAALEVFEELASHEAAAAWIVWNNTLPALLSRTLSAETRRALFGSSPTVTANSTRPTGRALRERDGYRISGRWSLVSGCELADVFLLRAIVPAPQGAPPGPPEMIMAYLPKDACRIVDTWNAGGLRGSGSHDVIVENAWVSAERCVSFLQPLQLTAALYRMPFAASLSAGCASIGLGIARGALETLRTLAQTKVLTDRGVPLRDQPGVLVRVARAQAQLAAARAYLHEAVGEAWRACEAQVPVTLEQRAGVWKAALHAAASAKDVVRSAYELAGASALYESCPLERAHRDLHAVGQHVILQELWLEESGRVALGVAPLSPMFMS